LTYKDKRPLRLVRLRIASMSNELKPSEHVSSSTEKSSVDIVKPPFGNQPPSQLLYKSTILGSFIDQQQIRKTTPRIIKLE